MTSKELVLLLPCNHWDDFPLELEGPDADAVLAAWTTLWDPRLLTSLGGVPGWQPADNPPLPASEMVVLVPGVSRLTLPIGWLDELVAAGGSLIEAGPDRGALLRATLEELAVGPTGGDMSLAADFRALGLAYLQIQLLTREMHYSNQLDDTEFGERLQQSARSLLDGEKRVAAEGVSRLFEMLVEARDHFYPVDAHLVDLTLLAPSTLGGDLARELAAADDQAVPINLIASGQVIEYLAEREPETLEQLRHKLANGLADLAGGAYAEAALPDTTPEAILAELIRGRETYCRHLSKPVTTFGSRHACLTPSLPQILGQIGFQGVLHMALDGSRLPKSEQCKTRWQGCDGTTIDALSGPPLDAADAGSFLRLARRMSESMDHDFVATVCLAHWPARASVWYDDLKRIARYGPVMGRFVTLEDYFEQTETPDLASQFPPDRYRREALSEAVASAEDDPVSARVRQFERGLSAELEETFRAMADLAAGWVGDVAESGDDRRLPVPQLVTRQIGESDPSSEVGDFSEISRSRGDREISGGRQASEGVWKRLLASLGPADLERGPGKMAFNPLTHGQRMVVDRDARSAVAVDVPGMGFAWSAGREDPGKGASSRRSAVDVRLAEDHLLRNEYFEVRVNPKTGAIQAIFDYRRRGNRLSQQVAYRSQACSPLAGPGPHDRQASVHYSHMVADRVEITSAGPTVGEITSYGQLFDGEDRPLAGFQQRLRVVRGSRIIGLEIELDPEVLPEGPPWENYYAVRFAWPDGLADICRSVTMDRQPTGLTCFEAPHYVQRSVDGYRVAILGCGLAFHRVSGPRTLDTLLVVQGETARSFRMGIGLEIAHPLHASLVHTVQQTPCLVASPCPARAEQGWLLHVDSENVAITACQPLCGSAPSESASAASVPTDVTTPDQTSRLEPEWQEEGRVTGFRLRLLEAEGRACRVHVRSFRDVRSARLTDFLGQPLGDLVTDKDRVAVDLNAHQWVQIEAWW